MPPFCEQKGGTLLAETALAEEPKKTQLLENIVVIAIS
jgi:hypothetical protein